MAWALLYSKRIRNKLLLGRSHFYYKTQILALLSSTAYEINSDC